MRIILYLLHCDHHRGKTGIWRYHYIVWQTFFKESLNQVERKRYGRQNWKCLVENLIRSQKMADSISSDCDTKFVFKLCKISDGESWSATENDVCRTDKNKNSVANSEKMEKHWARCHCSYHQRNWMSSSRSLNWPTAYWPIGTTWSWYMALCNGLWVGSGASLEFSGSAEVESRSWKEVKEEHRASEECYVSVWPY